MDAIEDEIVIVTVIVRVLSVVMCLLSMKWRKLANYLVYIDCLERIIQSMTPLYLQEARSSATYSQEYALNFLFLYCDTRWHLLAIEATFAFVVLVPQSYVYLAPLTAPGLVMTLFIIIVMFIGLTCFAMVITHITHLYSQLEFSNSENGKLLDAMHEGLCIFNDATDPESKNEVLFCNSQARKMFKQFVCRALKSKEMLNTPGFSLMKLQVMEAQPDGAPKTSFNLSFNN